MLKCCGFGLCPIEVYMTATSGENQGVYLREELYRMTTTRKQFRLMTMFATIVLLLVLVGIQPQKTAHALAPLSVHNARQANSSESRHLVIPLSPTSNCNLDGPSESGLFLCAVDSSVAPGCLIEHTTPHLGTGNRAGQCYSAGTVLGIICQTTGDLVNNTTRVWDFLVAGGYVTDFYMDTSGINGAFSPPIRRC